MWFIKLWILLDHLADCSDKQEGRTCSTNPIAATELFSSLNTGEPVQKSKATESFQSVSLISLIIAENFMSKTTENHAAIEESIGMATTHECTEIIHNCTN
ncbi:hypothetical protein CsatA_003035 [Cannabis sativa]